MNRLKHQIIPSFAFLLLAFLAAKFIAPATGGPDAIQSAITQLEKDPDLDNATISFLVTDSATGETVASLNPQVSTVRASAQKLFVTSTALELLGPGYRPKTRIYARGSVADGVLDGDLLIRGGGDPSLGSRHFCDLGEEDRFLQEWAEAVRGAGITSVAGRVVADGSAFGYEGVPDGWSWFDTGNYYGAGPAGLCLYDNAIQVMFRTGAEPGDPAKFSGSFPEIPELRFRSSVLAADVRHTNVAFFGAPYSYDRFAEGTLPLNSERAVARASMPDPEWRMAVEFARVLETKGVAVRSGPAGVRRNRVAHPIDYGADAVLLHSHEGPTIEELVRVTNQQSVNLFAEQLVCLIGYEQGGTGTTREGLSRINAYFEDRIDTDGLHLVDGCGMSRGNAVNGQHVNDMLNLVYNSANGETFHNTLAVAGESGTLENVCKGASGEGRIFAKTGTMTRAKSFVGYVYTLSGRKLTFAFTIVNFDCTTWEVTKKMVKILNIMAES